jgi:hypothetical protein
MGGNNDVMYKLFPPRETLVKDIPAGDGNIEKLFYDVLVLLLDSCITVKAEIKCTYSDTFVCLRVPQ